MSEEIFGNYFNQEVQTCGKEQTSETEISESGVDDEQTEGNSNFQDENSLTNRIQETSPEPGLTIPILQKIVYLRAQVQDLKKKPKYLVTFTVGLDQRNNIDEAVKKFSEDFMIMLFHYDGRTSEWDQFEWSKSAIHVSIRRQTKRCYAKRIFIWNEDLGVQHLMEISTLSWLRNTSISSQRRMLLRPGM
ncbi:hypothetical protein I3760_16G021200 [Carya illinoinensis]|nr:hypothetical protein I3760_16G021200 [Carya illinoinensis]